MNIFEHLESIKNEINLEFRDSFVNRIQQISDCDFLLCFSKGKNKSLLLSTNLTCPFVKITDKKFNLNSSSSFFQTLKSKINNAHFIEARTLNKDNILALDFIKTTDTYDRIELTLVIELFKSNANLILLNHSMVLTAFRFKGLDTNHPILPNLNYELPTKTLSFKEFDSIELNRIEKYYQEIETKFLKEKYKKLITLLKRKKKSSSKKLEKLHEEHEGAILKGIYRDYGDYLKMHLNEVKRGDKLLNVDGIEIKLNEQLTPTQNLEHFYKVYKKSKSTIVSTEKFINQTENEIKYIDSIINSIDSFKENEYEDLIYELSQNKVIKISSKKSQKQLISAAKPYFIIFNGVKIGYGKTNIQNDELTFKYANQDNWFLHIANDHGPHVVIFDNDPNDEIIQFACELSLALCKHNDGDVIFAQVKTLKKTSTLGLVKLSKYETYHINKIRNNIEQFINASNRF